MPTGIYPHPIGEKACRWKGGISKDYHYQRDQRHKLGINKEYYNMSGLSHTLEYKRLMYKKDKARRKKLIGNLSILTIQMVYEDNIKKYGTLTCYLCLQTITFGDDQLEHKIPISRGGTNIYDNLEVACSKCNRHKNDKTVEEYLTNHRRKE